MNNLYPYQLEGAVFLAERPRAFLADEQGLGKTVQAVHAADLAGASRVHVVGPAAARPVWRREIPRWSYTGFEALVQSYDELVRSGSARAEAARFNADTLILDEAHYLKSPDAQRTEWAYSGANLRRPRVWALSGTPMPNHAGEWWTHLHALAGLEQEYWDFAAEFAYVRWVRAYRRQQVSGLRRAKVGELKELLRPILLRRTASILDLPPLRWGILPVEGSADYPDPEVARKLEVLLERDEEALSRAFPHAAQLRRAVGLAKVPGTVQAVQERLEAGPGKVVLFGWHRDVLEALYAQLSQFNPVMIHGSIGADLRATYVDAFQSCDDVRVFIGQIQAAGTAITLTAANWVVFVESDWSPANIAQAAKRAHRIGQESRVLVQLVTLPDSLDESIQQVFMRKARDITLVLED